MDFLNANGMKKNPHPPCSPDFAPSEFFLFADVKRRLNGYSFDNADDLLMAIHHILDGYDRSIFISVLKE
jgi:transposase